MALRAPYRSVPLCGTQPAPSLAHALPNYRTAAGAAPCRPCVLDSIRTAPRQVTHPTALPAKRMRTIDHRVLAKISRRPSHRFAAFVPDPRCRRESPSAPAAKTRRQIRAAHATSAAAKYAHVLKMTPAPTATSTSNAPMTTAVKIMTTARIDDSLSRMIRCVEDDTEKSPGSFQNLETGLLFLVCEAHATINSSQCIQVHSWETLVHFKKLSRSSSAYCVASLKPISLRRAHSIVSIPVFTR